MRKRIGTVLAVTVALAALATGCSKSQYEKCADAAGDEWKAQQERFIENGGSNSVKGYYLSREKYIIDHCGVEPD